MIPKLITLSAVLLILAGAWLALSSPLTVSWEEPSRHTVPATAGTSPPPASRGGAIARVSDEALRGTIPAEINRAGYQWMLARRGPPPWPCAYVRENAREIADELFEIGQGDPAIAGTVLMRLSYAEATCQP